MDAPSSDSLTLIRQLLPGFVAAWVRFRLVPSTRRNDLDRVVEAMVLSGVIAILIATLRWLLQWPCRWQWVCVAGPNVYGELAGSLLLALVLGLILAQLTRSDRLFSFLRNRGWTRESSQYSLRYQTFTTPPFRFAVLHLKDGRRVKGRPSEGDHDPEHPESGYVLLKYAKWLGDQDDHATERYEMLVPWAEIQLIQFLENPSGGVAHAHPNTNTDTSEASGR